MDAHFMVNTDVPDSDVDAAAAADDAVVPHNASTCTACREVFDQHERRPLVNNCGHSFCLECVSHLSRCPVCRCSLLKNPPLNWALQEALTQLAKQRELENENAALRIEVQQLKKREESALNCFTCGAEGKGNSASPDCVTEGHMISTKSAVDREYVCLKEEFESICSELPKPIPPFLKELEQTLGIQNERPPATFEAAAKFLCNSVKGRRRLRRLRSSIDAVNKRTNRRIRVSARRNGRHLNLYQDLIRECPHAKLVLEYFANEAASVDSEAGYESDMND